MVAIQRFEDIDAWQKARELVREIYRTSDDGPFARDFAFRDQIRRAAVSVMSNIAEGFGRAGNREFSQFLSIAKGSVSEVQSQLYIALDVGYIDQGQFDHLYGMAETAGKMAGGLIRYLKKSDRKGSKYE